MQTVMYVGLEKYCDFDFLLASLRSDRTTSPHLIPTAVDVKILDLTLS